MNAPMAKSATPEELSNRQTVGLSGQLEDVGLQNWKLILDDVPENFMLENVVSMSQHVSQTDDFVNITNFLSKIRVVPSQPGQCFADDLKLTFDDQLQCTIFLKITEGPVVAKGLDLLDGP